MSDSTAPSQPTRKPKAPARIKNTSTDIPLLYHGFVTLVASYMFSFFYTRCFELISMCTRAPLHFFLFLAIVISLISLYLKPPATFSHFARRLVLTLVVFSQVGKEMDTTFSNKIMQNYSMQDKVSIVTFADDGRVGSTVTAKLASLGSTVIMACEDISKCHAARDKIYLDSKNKNISIPIDALITMELRLSDLRSVYDFTKEFKQKFNRLDVLINNVDDFNVSQGLGRNNKKTEQGYESTLGTLHLGTMALSNWLYDPLTALNWDSNAAVISDSARVIFVGAHEYLFGSIVSDAPSWWDPDNSETTSLFTDDNLGSSFFGGDFAYARSKLANILTAFEMQKRLDKASISKRSEGNPRRKVVTSVVNPGTTSVAIESKVNDFVNIAFIKPFLRKLDSAVSVILYAIYSDDYVPGSYIDAMTYNHDLLKFAEKYNDVHSAAYSIDNSATSTSSESKVKSLSAINYFSLDIWHWKNNDNMQEEAAKKLWESSQKIIKHWKSIFESSQ
jgi:NAD(P)-dependent dehydrogenase (short-subunit alcohol dehydrogenase family)